METYANDVTEAGTEVAQCTDPTEKSVYQHPARSSSLSPLPSPKLQHVHTIVSGTMQKQFSQVNFSVGLRDDQYHVDAQTNRSLRSIALAETCIRLTLNSQWRFLHNMDSTSQSMFSKVLSMSFSTFKVSKIHSILARSCFSTSKPITNEQTRDLFHFAKFLAKFTSGSYSEKERLHALFHEMDADEDGFLVRDDLKKSAKNSYSAIKNLAGEIASFVVQTFRVNVSDRTHRRILHARAVQGVISYAEAGLVSLEHDTLVLMNRLCEDGKVALSVDEFTSKLMAKPGVRALLDPVYTAHLILRSNVIDGSGQDESFTVKLAEKFQSLGRDIQTI